MIGLWRKRMLDYVKANKENSFTANDIDEDDMVILFKDVAGANQYDRLVPISLLMEVAHLDIPYGYRDDLEVSSQGQTVFNLSFEPSDIAMVFVEKQLQGPLDYTIVDAVITMHRGLNLYNKLTVIG